MIEEVPELRERRGPATLALPRGAADLELRAGAPDGRLITKQFSGPQPTVSEAAETVVVSYPRSFRRTTGRIGLHPEFEWTIAVRGPALRWEADLTGVALASVMIDGGAKQSHILLPQPGRRVPISINGGADRLKIVRPPTVAVDLAVDGGANGLIFDEQRLGGLGGSVRLESRPGDPLAGSYEIHIGSGAHQLEVTTTDRDNRLDPSLIHKKGPQP